MTRTPPPAGPRGHMPASRGGVRRGANAGPERDQG
jgi:hypothetical protein